MEPQGRTDLIEKTNAGDLEAREELITSSLRLVSRIAKKYIGKGMSYQELLSVGTLGLIEAVQRIEKYDQRKGKFSTYAARQIMTAILDEFKKCIDPLPKNNTYELSRLERFIYKTKAEKGRSPTLQEMSESLGVGITTAKGLVYKRFCLGRDGNSGRSEDACADSGYLDIIDTRANPEKDVLDRIGKEQLMHILQRTLTPEQFKVIELRYGLNGYDKSLTLETVGEKLKISASSVSYTQKKALARLRHCRYSKVLRSMLGK